MSYPQMGGSYDQNRLEDAAKIPGDPYCRGCSAKITAGMMFMYLCSMHAVCSSCKTNVKYEENKCSYCDEDEKKQLVRSPEPRNSLELITIAEPKFAVNVPQTFEYPPLHPTPSVQSFTYTGSLTLPYDAATCWPAGDSVIVGGQEQPTLTSVLPSGQMVRHTINCAIDGRYDKTKAGCVKSGVCVINSVVKFLHMVCVGYGQWRKCVYKINLLVLDPSSCSSSVINPIATLDVRNPIHVFRISRQLYGVLYSAHRTRYYLANGRIRIFGLNELVLPKDTDPRTLQSTSLWGRRSLVHLDISRPDMHDIVSVTSRGRYCVVSYWWGEVRVYSSTGVYLYTLGEHVNTNLTHPGQLWHPNSIQVTADHIMVITCEHGDVHCYKMDSRTGTLDVRGQNELYKSDSTGWWFVKGEREEGLVHNSTMSATRRWTIEPKNMDIVHKYDINTK